MIEWSPIHGSNWSVDFVSFLKEVFGMDLDGFQEDGAKVVSNANNRFCLVIWPRGHLKTTIFSKAYSLWQAWRKSNFEVCITSSALDQSQKIIEDISYIVENNNILKDLVPQKELTWNKSQLTFANNSRIYLKPFGSTARGAHVDLLVCDDILRDETYSQEQIKELFWSVFYPMVQTRKGQLLLVGTPMTTKDLFADIVNPSEETMELYKASGINYSEIFKIFKTAAIRYDAQGNWLEPVWKKRFSLQELKLIQANQGTLRFQREYMCEPMAAQSSLFKNIKIGKQGQLSARRKNCEYFAGIDTAMSSKEGSDYLVISVIERDDNLKLKQVRLERYKGKDESFIVERIRELNRMFKLRKVVIESNGLAYGMVKSLMDRTSYPDIASIIEGYNVNKSVGTRRSKEEIISSIISSFDSETLEILDNPIQYNELISFQVKEKDGKFTYEGVGAHDDCVMALGYSVFAAIEHRSKASISFI